MKFPSFVVLSTTLYLVASASAAAGTPAVAPASRAATPAPQVAQVAPSPLITTMQGEIEREMAILGKADPSAYYLGYTLTDTDRAEVVGSNGALLR